MRKVSLLKNVMLAAAVVALASCGKEQPVDPTKDFSVSDPASIIENLQISKILQENVEYHFGYENGKLIGVQRTYNAPEGDYKSSSDYNLLFMDDQLTSVVEEYSSISTYSDGTTETYNEKTTNSYEYNEDGLMSVIRTIYEYSYDDGNEYLESNARRLEYDEHNKLVKVVDIEEDGVSVEGTEWLGFEWSGHNVTRETGYYLSTEGARKSARLAQRERAGLFSRFASSEEIEGESVYSDFDEKTNPFMIMALLNGRLSGEFIAVNNPGKITYYDLEEGVLVKDDEMTIEYEYDAKGRPTKRILTEIEDGVAPVVSEATIIYKD